MKIILTFVFLISISAFAQMPGGPNPMRSMALGILGLAPPKNFSINYGGWVAPGDDPTSILQHRVNVLIPVHHDEKDQATLSLGGSTLHFNEKQTLSDSGTLVPANLYRAETGGHYLRHLEGDKMVGGRVSFGSSSDHLFSQFDVNTVSASAYYSFPTSDSDRWVFSLFFSNNNPIINYVPIPGFVYLHQTKTFTGMFGIPFTTLIWSPTFLWNLSLSFFGPLVSSEVAFGFPRAWQVFTAFNSTQQSYLRQARSDKNYRLYFNEKRGVLGFRLPLARFAKVEVSGGYAFDRTVNEGKSFNKKAGGEASLRSSWLATWNLRFDL